MPDLEAAANRDQGCGAEVVSRLVGPPQSTHEDVYADTSVPRLLPLGVPQDLGHGAQDAIVPRHFGTDYAEMARKAGDAVSLRFIPATGHVELVAPETAAWTEAKRLVAKAFLRARGGEDSWRRSATRC